MAWYLFTYLLADRCKPLKNGLVDSWSAPTYHFVKIQPRHMHDTSTRTLLHGVSCSDTKCICTVYAYPTVLHTHVISLSKPGVAWLQRQRLTRPYYCLYVSAPNFAFPLAICIGVCRDGGQRRLDAFVHPHSCLSYCTRREQAGFDHHARVETVNLAIRSIYWPTINITHQLFCSFMSQRSAQVAATAHSSRSRSSGLKKYDRK